MLRLLKPLNSAIQPGLGLISTSSISYVEYLVQFPADKYSVSYNGKMDGKSVDRIVDKWVRASELYQNPEMIKNGLAKDDVNQGKLGREIEAH